MKRLGLFMFAVWAFGSILAAPAIAGDIPVNCGDTLSVPGGHYVLTGNLACPASPAVHVTANNVTFDLKGFTLSKTGSAIGAGIITAAGNTCVATSGVHIHNGTITNFGAAIQICVPTPPGPVATHTHINEMILTGNGSGIQIFNGNDNDIHNNKITNNLIDVGVFHGVGILLSESDGNQIKQNVVNFNEADGIRLLNSDHNHISGNTTNTNRESGIHIETGSAKNLVARNAAHNNASFDLADDNRNCGTNDWDSNSFGTRSQSCIQ
jgi:parallel beta-helix repeat protein